MQIWKIFRPPDELANDIIENLQSALESFQELQEQLDYLPFQKLTVNTRNGLSSTSRKPYNVAINIKDGMIEEIAAVIIERGVGATYFFGAGMNLTEPLITCMTAGVCH